MNIKNTLNVLIRYYNQTRGRGHSYLMLHGALDSRGITIFRSNQSAKNVLNGLVSKPRFVSLENIEQDLRGMQNPIAFDNFALQYIFSEAYSKIVELEQNMKVTSERNCKLERKILDYGGDPSLIK